MTVVKDILNLTTTKTPVFPILTIPTNETTENQKLSTNPVRPAEKMNLSREKCHLEVNAAKGPPSRKRRSMRQNHNQ